MNPEQLRPFVDAIKKNPEDPYTWLQLGDVANLAKDLSTAIWAYLSAVYLRPKDESVLKKCMDARQKFIQSQDPSAFNFQLHKLPRHILIVVLVGVMNMDLDPLEDKIKSLIKAGFTQVIFDFSGVGSISGLAPSFLRRLHDHLSRQKGELIIVRLPENARNMLQLKNIRLTQYPDIADIFNHWNEQKK